MENTERPVKSETIVSPESSANFEGNDSLLLFERVSNSVIREQIISLIEARHNERAEMIARGNWEVANPQYVSLTGERDDNLFTDPNTGEYIMRKELTKPRPTREEIEAEFDKRFEHVSTITEITFEEGAMPSTGGMPLDWDFPGQDEKPSVKQKAIALAHEKGHKLRPFATGFYDRHFSPGFDTSQSVFSEEDYILYNKSHESPDGKKKSFEEFIKGTKEYLFSGWEITERMSQLKNYFGFNANQEFTREHLQYAREHYVSDTKLDNHMTQFFQAITTETEDEFLRLINSSGI